jgi:GT2 family glycosyltransferase
VASAEDRTRANSGLGPVSVVVCNYNGERYLSECLAAVFAMDGVVDDVIVVDNHSSDAGLALVRVQYPAVVIVEMGRNEGPCPARNEGMRRAKQRWVLALDNDAVVTRDMLAKLCAAVAEGGDAGRAEESAPPRSSPIAIAQPRSVFASEPSRVHYDGGSLTYTGLIGLRNFYTPIAAAEGRGNVPVDCAVAVALLVDRDALLALGGYDETMFILFEDLDLSFRLRATGKRIVSVEDAIVLHKGGTPGISFREGPSYPGSRVFFHSRNRWTYMAKCFHVRTLVVAAPGILVYELVWLVFATLQGGLGPWLRGKWRFMRLGAHVWRERQRFQAARSVPDRALLAGGPLTITPALKSGGAKASALRALDALLRGWWRLARWLAA